MTTMNPTMTRTISNQELLALEREYWDAIKDRDTATVGRLTDPDSTVAGPTGVAAFDPPSIAKFMTSTAYKVRDYRIDAQTVRVNRICDDAVTIAYGVHEDLEVDGKPIQVEAFDTSVWKQIGDSWACVLHTESLKGDPYGRDRTPGRFSS
jgi:ketosteroid isomerase-like protein